MGKKELFKKTAYRVIAVLLAACIFRLSIPEKGRKMQEIGIGQLIVRQAERAMLSLWCPALLFAFDAGEEGFFSLFAGQYPVLTYFGQEKKIRLQSESAGTKEEIIKAEGRDEYTERMAEEELNTPEESGGRLHVDLEAPKLLQEENEKKNKAETVKLPETEDLSGNAPVIPDFLPPPLEEGKADEYQWQFYEKYDALVKEFYAVDAATAIDSKSLNLKALLGKDLSLQKGNGSSPQILIYHTHSQEGFADSIPGNADTSIMGVGEVLTQILEKQYGYRVLHHLGQYDVENRDYAYNNSLPALEKLLSENPGIEVILDLHRDEVASERKLLTQVEGRPTAMLMFFNGLSRTKKHGNIESLPNENLADNLAFSFQMQALCNEYYPGLTRRIYLKGYRYNMHLKPRTLLVEMGGQTNTYEECYNACIPLARMLDALLSGVDWNYPGN